MARFDNPLRHVRVAAPCKAEWERMRGGERMRFCEQCSLNVYNLSGMTRREAETLLSNAEGRLCVRFYRRADGTILTSNCPVGLRALKRRVSRVASAALSAVIGFFAGLGVVTSFDLNGSPVMGETTGTLTNEEPAVMGVSAAEGAPSFESEPQEMGKAALGERGWVSGRLAVRRTRPITKRVRKH